MKTKKTSKILSVVLTLAILVCSLSAVSGFITTAETNPKETELIDSLKTEWGKLSKDVSIAELNTKVLVNNKNATNITPSDIGITFNKEDNTFDKTSYNGSVVGGEYRKYGLVFSKNDNGEFFNSSNDDSFNDIFSDDSLYFTFNPGEVTAAGDMWVILQYNETGGKYILYATVSIDTNASNIEQKIEINKLEFKTYDGKSVVHHTNLSDLLTYTNTDEVTTDLFTIKVMFHPDLVTTGASISELKTVKKETLPAGNESFTALQWYNAAKKLDVNGYENAVAFNTALNNLKTYLSNNSQDFLASELENAWRSLFINSSIANSPLTLPYMQNQMTLDNIIGTTDLCAKTFTFNQDGTFDKTPASTETYARGLLFNVNTDTKELFTSSSSAFSNAFNNNDSLYFTFNPGTVNAGGNLLVILQYNDYGTKYLRYAEVPVNVGDTGDKKIEIEKLTYKCADATNYPGNYTFTKLSDMLNQFNSKDLFTIKIMFDKNVNIEGATISALQGAKYAPLPEGNENFTALQWYNAAKDLDVNGYENAVDFTTALNNLKTYLSNNSQDFWASELKESWGKLSKDVSIAELNTTDLGLDQKIDLTKSPATIGITFENNTFNKTLYNGTVVGGEYQKYGLVFSKKDNGVFFNSSNDASFNDIFSNDSLYFTFNPGTVTTAGRMWVILQYNGDGRRNVLYGTVEIPANDSTAKKIVIKDLEFKCGYNDGPGADTKTYKFDTLSEALEYTNSLNEDKQLFTIKVMFNPGLETTGASISELKMVKTETVPGEEDSNELILRKSLRVDTGFYEEIAKDFVENRDKLYDKLMTGKVLGNVNETETGDVDICDLVALKDLGYKNDETYKLIADMNKDGYITEADKTALISNILNQ